jgi:predicted nuclease of predicted toxin-antitoxin system
MPNGEIFKKAASEGRIVLTFDLDFGEVVALSEGLWTGVVLFRLHNTCTSHVIDRLRTVLQNCSHTLEQGATVVVEESRHRTRRWHQGT